MTKYRHRPCFEYIIARQWGRKTGKSVSLPLIPYCRVLQWAERARKRALLTHGTGKTTFKGVPLKRNALVGSGGLLIDGFSQKPAKSLPYNEVRQPVLKEQLFPAIILAKRKAKLAGKAGQSSLRSASVFVNNQGNAPRSRESLFASLRAANFDLGKREGPTPSLSRSDSNQRVAFTASTASDEKITYSAEAANASDLTIDRYQSFSNKNFGRLVGNFSVNSIYSYCTWTSRCRVGVAMPPSSFGPYLAPRILYTPLWWTKTSLFASLHLLL